jgi:phenylalanyl-tRNA synthetase beta chain
MLFSESWLRHLVAYSLSSEQLAHQLTMAGLEVESCAPVAPVFSGVLVAEVLSVQPHPNAERLSLCSVGVGDEAPLQIVCGAKNVAKGIKVPCATVGAVLPGDFQIKPAKLRGVESFGMLCSAKELGLQEDVDGLLILPEEFTVGQSIRDALLLDDRCFALKVTPNRADCLSMQGLAREVAALNNVSFDASLSSDKVSSTSSPVKISNDQAPVVRVDQLNGALLTPHFSLRSIRGVDVSRSTPLWMQQRLERAGIRCINLVVDITNYVMLELGQPLHAYDASLVQGNVSVRQATPQEEVVLLNQQNVALTPDTVVIADALGVLGLAGVMGGLRSSVTNQTTDILLESAYWYPESVSGKARYYGVSSEAAFRFERGVDPKGVERALERATALILHYAGGEAGSVYKACDQGALPMAKAIRLRHSRITRILGFELESAEIAASLVRLGCVLDSSSPSEWMVFPPSWRVDLAIEEDLIEELARLKGYDAIPVQAPTPPLSFLPTLEPTAFSLSQLRARCVDLDYQEAITYSFVSDEVERQLRPDLTALRLLNPIAQTMNVMRTTLWSGLLPVLQNAIRRKIERVRLFEVGRVFQSVAHQPLYMAGLAYGSRVAEQWDVARDRVDFYDVKADLESLFKNRALHTVARPYPGLHPGRSAVVVVDGREVGMLGELHPSLAKLFDLSYAPILYELSVEALYPSQSVPTYSAVFDLPVVRRDLALVVPRALAAQEVLDVIQQSDLQYLEEVTLFDVFEGGNLEPHLKSLAVRLQWQPETQTLTDADIQADVQHVLDRLHQHLGVVLRN